MSSTGAHSTPRRRLASTVVACGLMMSLGACTGELSQNTGMAEPGTDSGQGPGPVADMTGSNPDAGPGSMTDAGEPSGDQGMTPGDMGSDQGGPPIPINAPNPNALPQPQLFTCTDPSAPRSSPARLSRIINPEWSRAMGRGYKSDYGKNPYQPDADARYSTHRQNLSIDAPTLDQMLNFEAPKDTNGSTEVIFPINRWAVGITCLYDEGSMPSDECISESIQTILERRVYFRPARTSQRERLEAFARAQFDKDLAGTQSRTTSIHQTLLAAWLTTDALYRGEFGQQDDGTGRYRLTDWELAHALTYTLTDRAPAGPERATPRGLHTIEVFPEVKQAAFDGTLDKAFIAAFVRANLSGDDPGTLDPHGDPEVLPPEIEVLTGDERRDAIAAWTGREDLWLDFEQSKHRNRRSRYWMSEKLRRFFREWLAYSDLVSIFKDEPFATSRFDTSERNARRMDTAYKFLSGVDGFNIHAYLDEQLDETIARVVVADQEVFKRLMTTRDFFTRAADHPDPANHYFAGELGYIYDIDTYVDKIPDTRAGRWQVMPQNQRAGVLTHPAWLAAHGGNFDNDPSAVERGKWIRENLLCGIVPDLPIGVAAQLDPDTIDLPARQRIAAKTDVPPECSTCHSLMNPLGYAFEIYNHAGYMRFDDHGFDPDGSSTLLHMPSGDNILSEGMQVRDAVEMMEKFGDSQHVKRCFIRHTFRYFMGRNETMADACTLAEMEQAYDDNGGSMTEMMVTLMTSDTFLYRTRSTSTEP